MLFGEGKKDAEKAASTWLDCRGLRYGMYADESFCFSLGCASQLWRNCPDAGFQLTVSKPLAEYRNPFLCGTGWGSGKLGNGGVPGKGSGGFLWADGALCAFWKRLFTDRFELSGESCAGI